MAEILSSPRRIGRAATSKIDGDEKTADLVGDLVAACQQGEREAQRRLYEICHERIYQLMVRMVGIQDAADMTQQTFLQAFRCLGQYAGRSRFETWLYRLAVNESLQHLRRRRRWEGQALEHEPEDRSHDRRQNVEHRELLEASLARIDPELRSIFLLREVDELSYREIAEVLQIPEGTVGSRLNRARRELQEHLKDLGWEM